MPVCHSVPDIYKAYAYVFVCVFVYVRVRCTSNEHLLSYKQRGRWSSTRPLARSFGRSPPLDRSFTWYLGHVTRLIVIGDLGPPSSLSSLSPSLDQFCARKAAGILSPVTQGDATKQKVRVTQLQRGGVNGLQLAPAGVRDLVANSDVVHMPESHGIRSPGRSANAAIVSFYLVVALTMNPSLGRPVSSLTRRRAVHRAVYHAVALARPTTVRSHHRPCLLVVSWWLSPLRRSHRHSAGYVVARSSSYERPNGSYISGQGGTRTKKDTII